MAYASASHARDVRLEAALFIGNVCQTSLLTVRAGIPEVATTLKTFTASNVHKLSRHEDTG